MPEVFRFYGFSFFFYSKEHEPLHIHVEGKDGCAKFDLVDDDLDQDVIAIAKGKLDIYVVIMPVRNGKITGRDDFLMSGSEHDSTSEIISSFIQQYYGYNRHVPKQILLDEDIEDKELLEDWLRGWLNILTIA